MHLSEILKRNKSVSNYNIAHLCERSGRVQFFPAVGKDADFPKSGSIQSCRYYESCPQTCTERGHIHDVTLSSEVSFEYMEPGTISCIVGILDNVNVSMYSSDVLRMIMFVGVYLENENLGNRLLEKSFTKYR